MNKGLMGDRDGIEHVATEHVAAEPVAAEPVAAEPVATEPAPGKGSRLISRILPPAVRFWIQTQLDHVENLIFRLEASDRQVLSGYVPRVELSADRAVYQGIHLSHAQIQALEIHINLGQVLRGKPLRLLQRFSIVGEVMIQEEDLNQSLQAPLLQGAIQEFLQKLMARKGAGQNLQTYLAGWIVNDTLQFEKASVDISPNHLTLTLIPTAAIASPHPRSLRTALTVRDGQILVLTDPEFTSRPGEPPLQLEQFELDLGPEVALESLVLSDRQIEIRGTLQVVPARQPD